MIATTHHILPAWDSSTTAPHREDCLRWQGQTPGKQRLLAGNFQGTQLGGEDCPGLWALTAGTTVGAKIASGGICVAKITLGCGVRLLSGQHWRGLLVPEELTSGCLQLERGLVVRSVWYSLTDYNTATGTALMGTPAITLDNLNKVVVGFVNGGRTKGYVYNFTSLAESFKLLPQDDPLHGQEITVAMKDLKAVFFVWEFIGNPEQHDSLRADAPMQGRGIEVTFSDGEKIVGRPEGYNAQRIGFFIYPANPKGNNIRIFVVTRNTCQVRLV